MRETSTGKLVGGQTCGRPGAKPRSKAGVSHALDNPYSHTYVPPEVDKFLPGRSSQVRSLSALMYPTRTCLPSNACSGPKAASQASKVFG